MEKEGSDLTTKKMLAAMRITPLMLNSNPSLFGHVISHYLVGENHNEITLF